MEPNNDGRLRAIETKIDNIEKTVIRIRKAQRSAANARIVYWILIILVGFGAFYFLQPVVDQLKTVYGSFGGDSQQLDQLFQNFKQDF